MRVVKVKESGSETVSYTYGANGNKKSETLANGVSSDITIGKGYVIHKRSYWCMIHTSGSKRAVYCLEPGKDVTSGDTFSDPVTREDRRVCFYA